jgi:hypothetical protein
MAQYAVPISDVAGAATGVTTNGSCGPSYTSCIDDGIDGGSQNSGTYAAIAADFSNNGALKVNLTSLSDPDTGTKTLRIIQYTQAGFTVNLDVYLSDGTTTENLTFTNSSLNTWEELSQTVTSDLDWSSLTLEMVSVNFGATIRVGDAELEIPDAGGGGGGGGATADSLQFGNAEFTFRGLTDIGG